MRLTHAERDQVAEVLREAYAQGQLDEEEFDERLGQAMSAKIRGELAPLVADLPSASSSVPTAQQETGEPTRADRWWAVGGHLSGYFTLALGPLLVLLLRGDSPYVRAQALQALNYQLNFLIASMLMSVAWILVIPVFIYAFMLVGWTVLPVVAALAAAVGANWRYPFTFQLVGNGLRPHR